MTYPTLTLQKDQDRRLLAGHLWIYNNEIDYQASPMSGFTKGELVQVLSSRGKSLGIATLNPNILLCGRLLTRHSRQKIDVEFFKTRLLQAKARRELFYGEPFYRLVFSESDQLPGVIIDRFADVFVVQINTAGMENCREMLLTALIETFSPKAVVWRNDSAYRDVEQIPQYSEVAHGEVGEDCFVRENGCVFFVDPLKGQKTGWFYDHRANRAGMSRYVKNKRVLDIFSYTGAFSIALAKAGAASIMAIDSSASALEQLQRHAVHNQVTDQIQTQVGDAFAILKSMKDTSEKFDVIICDPPALIKRKKDFHPGVRAYQQLNQLALSLLTPGGVLFTASCSMHLSASDLQNCVRQAAVNCDREIAIVEQTHQGPDHPVHPAIPETNYLKGFIVA